MFWAFSVFAVLGLENDGGVVLDTFPRRPGQMDEIGCHFVRLIVFFRECVVLDGPPFFVADLL
jgi:hypothetical protein